MTAKGGTMEETQNAQAEAPKAAKAPSTSFWHALVKYPDGGHGTIVEKTRTMLKKSMKEHADGNFETLAIIRGKQFSLKVKKSFEFTA